MPALLVKFNANPIHFFLHIHLLFQFMLHPNEKMCNLNHVSDFSIQMICVISFHSWCYLFCMQQALHHCHDYFFIFFPKLSVILILKIKLWVLFVQFLKFLFSPVWEKESGDVRSILHKGHVLSSLAIDSISQTLTILLHILMEYLHYDESHCTFNV